MPSASCGIAPRELLRRFERQPALPARRRAHPDEVQVVRVVGERIETLRAALRDVVLVGLRRELVRLDRRRRDARRADRCAPACGRCDRRPASAAAGDRLRPRRARACRSPPTDESTGAARRDGSGSSPARARATPGSRASRRTAGRRASSSSTAADPSAPRRRASARRGRPGTPSRPRASRRRRRGRLSADPRPCRCSASPARRCRRARAASPSPSARPPSAPARSAFGSSSGVHRRVDVRPEHERLAPVRHRGTRIEPRGFGERARGLGMVERRRRGSGPD